MQSDSSSRLFDDFLVVGLASGSGRALEPKLLYHFNPSASADAASIVEFCFPEIESSAASESFTFTLTQGEGTRVFGFCRRLAQQATNPICLCVLSQRPWFSLFMHMHDILQLNYDLGRFVPAFVSAAYDAQLPQTQTGVALRIEPLIRGESYFGSFRLTPPIEDRPTGVNFEALLNSLGVPLTLRVLGALLTEQRVIFVGSRWGHVSGCAHAATVLLYPLQWQHIFIPVLPQSKLSYACAPMPFVLGVASRHLQALQQEPLDQVLFVDVDGGKLWGDQEALDAAYLPTPFKEHLHLALVKITKATKAGRMDNGAVAEAVLATLVRLLGSYRRYVRKGGGGASGCHPDFDEEAFIGNAPPSAQEFLRAMRSAQLFEVWLGSHVEMSEAQRKLSAFERAVASTPAEELGGALLAAEPLPNLHQHTSLDRLRSGVTAAAAQLLGWRRRHAELRRARGGRGQAALSCLARQHQGRDHGRRRAQRPQEPGQAGQGAGQGASSEREHAGRHADPTDWLDD